MVDEFRIEATDLHKEFDGKIAVDHLNLKVKKGELFCLLGPNGAGKTTTFKMATGLINPTSGTIRVAGYDVFAEPILAKRRIGYIPDRPYLYEKLSGRDFFTFVGDLFGIDRETQARKMEEYFTTFLLQEAKDQFIENYSHGMRQKLVFSTQLMHDPEVLVVDEPMVGLDPRSMRIVKKLMRDEVNRGKTVLLSTHTLSDVEEVADRIGVIARGKLIFIGTIDELRGELKHSGRLEDLFLQITEEEEAVPA